MKVICKTVADKKDSISIESQIELCKGETAEYMTRVTLEAIPAFKHFLKNIAVGKIEKMVVYKSIPH